jgi:ectoine hydroxylase-related dioxygenase (phytanoyl-CoA dioxygenase family)
MAPSHRGDTAAGRRIGFYGAVSGVGSQGAQVLHYEQGIYPLSRDRDVMVTAIWALDDFTAGNGATLVVPCSHGRAGGRLVAGEAVPVQMPAGSVLLFASRTWQAGGANTSGRSRLGVIIDYVQPWLRSCEAHTLSADAGHLSSPVCAKLFGMTSIITECLACQVHGLR